MGRKSTIRPTTCSPGIKIVVSSPTNLNRFFKLVIVFAHCHAGPVALEALFAIVRAKRLGHGNRGREEWHRAIELLRALQLLLTTTMDEEEGQAAEEQKGNANDDTNNGTRCHS